MERVIIKTVPIPLKILIDEMGEGESLNQLLSSFSCEDDADIEYFLRSRAVEFEKLAKARTYLLFDAEALASKSILEQDIIGYVAVAQKVLSVPDSMSNRMRKELDGLSAKIHGEQITDFSCYLIGQLGRNSCYTHEQLSGDRLLELASTQIATAVEAVGGRYMMIECKNEKKLIKFYANHGFVEISRTIDGEHEMIQMIRKI